MPQQSPRTAMHPRAAEPGWSAANLTAVAIERESKTARRRYARQLRTPDIAEALHLGIGSLVIPLVAPMAYLHANGELAKIARGEVLPEGRGWLVAAKVCSIIAMLGMLSTAMGVLGFVLAS
jgi:hypothetical protein